MAEELKIIRKEIENTLEKCERFETLLLLFGKMKGLSLFSVNKNFYIIHEESIYRMDNLFSADCTLPCSEVKMYLEKYIAEEYEKFTTSQFLRFCYEDLSLR